VTPTSETVNTENHGNFLNARWLAVSLILTIGVLLGLLYSPLLVWLGKTTLTTSQLNTGGLLVLFAIAICLRDTISTLRITPNLNNQGLSLLLLAFFCLSLVKYAPKAILPLFLFSFCLCFAALISFMFGALGVRQFLPALGGFFVFGLLVGLFPTLDWPLRAVAAKYSGSMLAWLGVKVHVILQPLSPPELDILTGGRRFRVATECNGFGLLTSSLLLATILGLQYRLAVIRILGLFTLAIPIAIIFNFLRIVSICLVAPRFPNASYHFIHETLGTVLYMAGLALVWYAAGEFADQKKPDNGDRKVPAEAPEKDNRPVAR